jgi:hypothetical protein
VRNLYTVGSNFSSHPLWNPQADPAPKNSLESHPISRSRLSVVIQTVIHLHLTTFHFFDVTKRCRFQRIVSMTSATEFIFRLPFQLQRRHQTWNTHSVHIHVKFIKILSNSDDSSIHFQEISPNRIKFQSVPVGIPARILDKQVQDPFSYICWKFHQIPTIRWFYIEFLVIGPDVAALTSKTSATEFHLKVFQSEIQHETWNASSGHFEVPPCQLPSHSDHSLIRYRIFIDFHSTRAVNTRNVNSFLCIFLSFASFYSPIDSYLDAMEMNKENSQNNHFLGGKGWTPQ